MFVLEEVMWVTVSRVVCRRGGAGAALAAPVCEPLVGHETLVDSICGGEGFMVPLTGPGWVGWSVPGVWVLLVLLCEGCGRPERSVIGTPRAAARVSAHPVSVGCVWTMVREGGLCEVVLNVRRGVPPL